jgi:AAA15 family ATPase/GTPase
MNKPLLSVITIQNFLKFKDETFSFAKTHCVVQGRSESGKISLVIALKLFGFAMNNCYDSNTREWKTYENSYQVTREILGIDYIVHHDGKTKNKARIIGGFSTGDTYTFNITSFHPLIIRPELSMPPPLPIYFTLIKEEQIVYDYNTSLVLRRQLSAPKLNINIMISSIKTDTDLYLSLLSNVRRFFLM